MRQHPRKAILIGVGAAAGAFAAAAMTSPATAPTARADDLTTLYSVVLDDFTVGQIAFSEALTDFSNNQGAAGLGALFDGVNTDTFGASANLATGLTNILTGEPVFTSPVVFGFYPPPDLTTALAEINTFAAEAQTFSSDAATALAAGEYGMAVLDSSLASVLGVDLPGEFLVMGALDQLGL